MPEVKYPDEPSDVSTLITEIDHAREVLKRVTATPTPVTTHAEVREAIEWLTLLKAVIVDDDRLRTSDAWPRMTLLVHLLITLLRKSSEHAEAYLALAHQRPDPESPDAHAESVVWAHQRDQEESQLMVSLNEVTHRATEFLKGIESSDIPMSELSRAQYSYLQTTRTLRAVQAAAEEIKKTQQEVSVAAGSVATGSLAASFESYTTAQARSARWWMAFAVIAVAAVAVVGVLLLRTQDPSWQQTVAHLVIALPAAGVAAYGARESSRHRESSQWARRVSAQLKAIGPYTDRLPEKQHMTLWASFGKYLFGPHAAGPVENQLQTVPPELLKALTDLVKASK